MSNVILSSSKKDAATFPCSLECIQTFGSDRGARTRRRHIQYELNTGGLKIEEIAQEMLRCFKIDVEANLKNGREIWAVTYGRRSAIPCVSFALVLYHSTIVPHVY